MTNDRNMTLANIPVKCTRCSHACMESEWLGVPSKEFPGCTQKTCPRCGCRSYYDCSPQVAWCWASGLIEIGDALPPDEPEGGGAIEIARGPRYALKGQMSAVARRGKGASVGKLLVPGVPEADTEDAKFEALMRWLAWLGNANERDGVTFAKVG